MDRNRIIGAAKQAIGALKEAVGKATGDAIVRGDGRADKLEGKRQSAMATQRTSSAGSDCAPRELRPATRVKPLPEVDHEVGLAVRPPTAGAEYKYLSFRCNHDPWNRSGDPSDSLPRGRIADVASQQQLGYFPSGGLGVILLIVVVLLLAGRI